MTDIQERLLSLLLEIDEICRENDIEYCIDGGTTLGAIRHRGFLPWDDDADILFTRDNWNKFRKVVNDNPREHRIIEDMYSNSDYTMVYGRYCDTSTTCILRTSMIDQFKSGLFIDLFILDPIPDTPESRKEYFEILSGYCEYLNPYYYDDIVGANEWYDRFAEMGARQGRQAVIDFVEKHLFSYPDVEGMTYGFRYDNGHWIYPRDVIGRPKRVPVEGVLLPVAEKVEDYLRIHYGDQWFMIPPTNEAETHNVVIDLNTPYQRFADSYMNLIDRPKAMQTYQSLHKLRVTCRKANASIDIHNYTMTAQLYSATLTKQIKDAGISLKEMISSEDYEGVRRILGNYYDIQLYRWYMFYHIFVPITDEQLFCALYVMLVDGNFSKADKILNLRKEQPDGLSKDLRAIEDLIASIRESVCCFERNDLNGVLRISSQQLKNHPNIRDFLENELRAKALLALASQNSASATAAMAQIDKQDYDIQSRDWIRAVRSMLQAQFGPSGTKGNAITVLNDLKESTSNGMLRLAIIDFCDSVK